MKASISFSHKLGSTGVHFLVSSQAKILCGRLRRLLEVARLPGLLEVLPLVPLHHPQIHRGHPRRRLRQRDVRKVSAGEGPGSFRPLNIAAFSPDDTFLLSVENGALDEDQHELWLHHHRGPERARCNPGSPRSLNKMARRRDVLIARLARSTFRKRSTPSRTRSATTLALPMTRPGTAAAAPSMGTSCRPSTRPRRPHGPEPSPASSRPAPLRRSERQVIRHRTVHELRDHAPTYKAPYPAVASQ